MDLLVGAVVPPGGEVVVRRALRRQVVRQESPLTVGPGLVEDRVHDLPHRVAALVAADGTVPVLPGREHRLDQRPLLVRRVALARLAFTHPSIPAHRHRTGTFRLRPHHQATPERLTTPTEAPPLTGGGVASVQQRRSHEVRIGTLSTVRAGTDNGLRLPCVAAGGVMAAHCSPVGFSDGLAHGCVTSSPRCLVSGHAKRPATVRVRRSVSGHTGAALVRSQINNGGHRHAGQRVLRSAAFSALPCASVSGRASFPNRCAANQSALSFGLASEEH